MLGSGTEGAFAAVKTKPNKMEGLYDRLRELGVTRAYVRDFILPDWWEDDAADHPAGYAEALLFISRHLWITLSSLRGEGPLEFDFSPTCKFKRRADAEEPQLRRVRALALGVASAAAAASPTLFQDLPPAEKIRSAILAEGAPWVGLEQMVDFCWSAGIPVIHTDRFPRGARKPEGMALWVGDNPVIVVSKAQKQASWLAFIIAHELGHIGLGHVEENSCLVDEKLQDDAGRDDEEEEANAFALTILTGSSKRQVLSSRPLAAETLARQARTVGLRQRIDPGHIVLNYGYSMTESRPGGNFFGVANAALKKLFPDEDAVNLIRQKAAENLALDRLPDDTADYLVKMALPDSD